MLAMLPDTVFAPLLLWGGFVELLSPASEEATGLKSNVPVRKVTNGIFRFMKFSICFAMLVADIKKNTEVHSLMCYAATEFYLTKFEFITNSHWTNRYHKIAHKKVFKMSGKLHWGFSQRGGYQMRRTTERITSREVKLGNWE